MDVINIPLTKETAKIVLNYLKEYKGKHSNNIAYAIDVIKFVLSNGNSK